MKVIDETLHSSSESHNSSVKFALITFYAKRIEDLPIARKIGDIVRIHRSNVKEFRGIKQFNANMAYNSAWCLFHSSDVLLAQSKDS
mmetsp:Transcript_2145/g.3208  ORF Transcript_2145/g.3208 Transcript_2145/m.3208 type:complete len:87 (+) Transcript_2145:164-424(+)